MAKTDDLEIGHQYLRNYLENMKKQLNQCEIKLIEQSQRYPIIKFSIEQIDHCLQGYVDCQRKYLTIRNKQQLVKFNDNIHEKDLFQIILSSRTTNNQVRINLF